MLILTLLFVAVLFLLLFSLTKDTGQNTKHARRNAAHYLAKMQPEESAAITTPDVAKVS